MPAKKLIFKQSVIRTLKVHAHNIVFFGNPSEAVKPASNWIVQIHENVLNILANSCLFSSFHFHWEKNFIFSPSIVTINFISLLCERKLDFLVDEFSHRFSWIFQLPVYQLCHHNQLLANLLTSDPNCFDVNVNFFPNNFFLMLRKFYLANFCSFVVSTNWSFSQIVAMVLKEGKKKVSKGHCSRFIRKLFAAKTIFFPFLFVQKRI